MLTLWPTLMRMEQSKTFHCSIHVMTVSPVTTVLKRNSVTSSHQGLPLQASVKNALTEVNL